VNGRNVSFWPKADILVAPHMSAFGVERTWPIAVQMSAFDTQAERWRFAQQPLRQIETQPLPMWEV
jgi:hypothetical protein